MNLSADSTALLPMFETPAHLAELTRQMQAAAPDLGLGFRRATLPPELHQRLMEQFRAVASRFQAEGPCEFLGNADERTIPALYFENPSFNTWLSQALRPLHEAWSGMRLAPSACYGIRVYQRGTFLYNHVDRTETHLVSSTICVDHQLDRPWPLYIEDVHGAPYQIDMQPGDMVFYEGARLVHGRAYPLDGRYYAAIFVHYRPASDA